MSIRVALHHATRYRYDRPTVLSPQTIRLRPAPHTRTPVLSWSLRVTPSQHFLNWQQDPQSNYLARVVFPEPTREFAVEVDLTADLVVINPFDFFLEPEAENAPFHYDPSLKHELAPFLLKEALGPRVRTWIDRLDRRPRRTIDFLVDINTRLQRDIEYVIRMEPGVQTCEETLERGRGSCRDSAWLMVQVLRHLGVAARFASGYLIQLRPDVAALDGPSGATHDFTDLHAWTEAYLPGAGWIGFDPTSGLLAGEGHIPLACAPDPTSAAPIAGLVGECEVDFSVEMSVQRLVETARVTKPYTVEQWDAIDGLGRRVDGLLDAASVRLTMGGEPTFVSIDDRDGDEWNLTALGPTKRRLAADLLRRLHGRFAPGGLLHFGQGKWYPGESLPRWALGCFWRPDGVPVWSDPALVADETVDDGATPEAAALFLDALATRLDVDPGCARPAYEDVWYYLARERRLPANVDPLDSRLDEPEERERLVRIFDRGLGSVVGHALPLRPDPAGNGRWETGRWFLRTEHMYLIPGDSPMGYRLPLDSLPWELEDDRQTAWDLDPLAPRRPLPARPRLVMQPVRTHPTPDAAPEVLTNVVRTALCVEPRDGRLHVFMPPVTHLEDYLDLVRAVEDTAREQGVRVLVEGYTPPSDPRLRKFEITPDPGVIEVNVHPAHGWSELAENTSIIYEEARLARLATEKFNVDGRHTGTGGGNHVTIGGPTTAESPLLRRPDLLRSLIAYWQNHPALSYLFAGLFIGPTSQAPRIDEARHDSLHELEIAFQQLPERSDVPPWTVDRALRHLLVDVTGNTHRAEFCIDKLYAPESTRGRLGLLELRAFEMPPHPQMSLVQQLLLRALIARFWTAPYRHGLVRWDTALHDRFLLPHFVGQDLDDVLADMAAADLHLDRAWFDPHMEFRFPLLGAVTYQGVEVELRYALEPWHVLGEEPGGGGTVRHVDSSLERLQVKVRGLTDTRHVITCNGRRVPLHPTGTVGEAVAGVRYRAWQPPTCLHPTIPVHAPLVFDVVDTWNGRSIGGCTYHVSHPGGLSHETRPINANEAEARRVARFQTFGHTPGAMTVPREERNPDFPLTLDLRR